MMYRVIVGTGFVGYVTSPSEIGALRKAQDKWGFGVTLVRECVTKNTRIDACGIVSDNLALDKFQKTV